MWVLFCGALFISLGLVHLCMSGWLADIVVLLWVVGLRLVGVFFQVS